MMDLVREWLLGITGVAILAAGADAMMPDGGVKQVGRLLCGLALLSAVLSPVLGWSGGSVEALAGEYGQTVSALAQDMEKERSGQMKQLIEQRLSAYSMDKMAQEGIPCQVRVECELTEDGVYLPVLVKVDGAFREEEWRKVTESLSAELGVDAAGFVFQEGGEG